jgi:RNA polymerase sigma-70 factor (sigma-E family)
VVDTRAGAEAIEPSFTAFVRAHTASLFTTAYLLTGDVGYAEELLQDTLVRLYPQWRRIDAANSPVAYVRRAVVNGFISARRRSDRVVALDHLGEAVGGRARPSASYAADGPADAVTDRVLVLDLMRALPRRQQAALVLRYFDDLPDAEIATILGCRPGTVRSLLSRGLAAMRSQLAASKSMTSTGGSRA